MNKTISLAQGNGGLENNELIKEVFYKSFKNDILAKSEDASIIEKNLAFTSDSFTINPIFFKGGDIGKLSICGTCNDLAMMGAKPKYISSAFMIEEGFSLELLKKIAESMRKELQINGAKIICGDTKILPKGSLDKIFINTSGIGLVAQDGISSNNIKQDDCIIISSSIARHGASIFASRKGIEISSELKSDCTSLWPIVEALIKNKIEIRALRDATRGGISAVLNEWAKQSNINIEVDEEKIPICEQVQGICEMLGFEPYDLANEGTFVLALKQSEVQKALDVLHSFDASKEAVVVARVSKNTKDLSQKVILKSSWGTKRFLDLPSGELLPRIC